MAYYANQVMPSNMNDEDEEELRQKNAMYAQNARDNAFGGTRNGKDMVLGTDPASGKTGWIVQNTGDPNAVGTRSWQESVRQQQALKQQEASSAFDNAQAEIGQIETTSKEKIALDNRNKQQWMLGMVLSANRNPSGMSDRSLSAGATKAVGQTIYGMQKLSGLSGKEAELNGSYAVYGPTKNQDGSEGAGIVGIVTPETILKTLDGLGAGAKYNQLRQELWRDGGFDRYTPSQQASMGLRNPNAVNVAGQTSISGNISKRLFGERNWRPSGVTTTGFSSDGVGGTTEWKKDWDTGETWKEEGGTRDPNYQGKWKVRQSGPDGTVYDNDKTGESITVPNGSSLRETLTNASSVKKPDGRDARLAAQIAASSASDAAKGDRQKRDLEYREYSAKRKEMADRRKQLENMPADGRAGKRGDKKYTHEQVNEILRDEFPDMFDADGNRVRWDYGTPKGAKNPTPGNSGDSGNSQTTGENSGASVKDGGSGQVVGAENADAEGNTASIVEDNSGGEEFKPITRDEFKKLSSEDKRVYLDKLKKHKAKEQGKK